MATLVLIHGAGTGSWLWDEVLERLNTAGHRAFALSLRGVERLPLPTDSDDVAPADDSTLSGHVEQLIDLIEREDLSDVTLVGLSYGGFVTTVASHRIRDRLARLIYVDAFMPQANRNFLDVLPAPVRDAFMGAARQHGAGRVVPPSPLAAIGGLGAVEPGVDAQAVLEVLTRRAGHPLANYLEVVAPDSAVPAAGIPRTYIICTDKPPTDPLLAIAAELRRTGWDVREIPAGHFVMLTRPDTLASLLLAD